MGRTLVPPVGGVQPPVEGSLGKDPCSTSGGVQPPVEGSLGKDPCSRQWGLYDPYRAPDSPKRAQIAPKGPQKGPFNVQMALYRPSGPLGRTLVPALLLLYGMDPLPAWLGIRKQAKGNPCHVTAQIQRIPCRTPNGPNRSFWDPILGPPRFREPLGLG